MDFIDLSDITAGNPPGGLNTVYEIKILICYLLSEIKEPISLEEMSTIFRENGWVNYFVFTTALEELKKTEHLSVSKRDKDEVYALNELGYETAHHLKTSLPSSLREKVVNAALNLFAQRKRMQEKSAKIIKISDGFMVECIVHDIGSDLLRMEVFAPDKLAAEMIRDQFLKDTVNVYKGIIGFLTKNKQSISEIMEMSDDNSSGADN